jgi:hypothetical protein
MLASASSIYMEIPLPLAASLFLDFRQGKKKRPAIFGEAHLF